MSDWPYAEDGVKGDEFAESLRIPLIGNPYPRWCYITAVVVSTEPHLWYGVRPTDDELRIVASFHQEYCEYWYSESYKRRMAERPFDLDGGANGRYLIKYPDGGWGYRHASWREGPCFVPRPQDAPKSLLAVLDMEKSVGDEISPRWKVWKATHPEVFVSTDTEIAQ